MNDIINKMQTQNLTISDYNTLIKIIQAALQRGTIRAEECTTVGIVYEKLINMKTKIEKENENARLSETDN